MIRNLHDDTRASKMANGWVSRMIRSRLFKQLESIKYGLITIEESGHVNSFGSPDGPTAHIVINDSRFYSSVLGGSAAIGGAYIGGAWDCDDLVPLFEILLRNEQCLNQVNRFKSVAINLLHRLRHYSLRNSIGGSQKNIAAHYDLGNDFYRLWLDDTMAYSSGIFRDRNQSLSQASTEKFDRVCRKLDLSSDTSVVEIGSGWGGFAIHAAENYQSDVTTTTISHEQFRETLKRVQAQHLNEKIRVLNKDYRHMSGTFDRLVSIEMIEAVGYKYFDQFFGKCGALLNDDGCMCLQAIVMPERRYPSYLKSVDFIQRYVFPGGCLPSVSAILESVGRSSDMRFVHAEDMAPHYAETLRRWRMSFVSSLPEIRALDYPEQLIRTWMYYLSYCEAAFLQRHVGVVQLVFDKPLCRRDPLSISEAAVFVEQDWQTRAPQFQ